MTCSVCCDPYTAIQRKEVACANCGYGACTRCVKAYLLSQLTYPNCMNCHHVWNREFLDTHLTRAWREGELKEHRGRLLWDRERSLLPATQPDVEIEVKKRGYAADIEAFAAEAAPLRERLKAIDDEIARRQHFIARGVERGAAEEKPAERRQFVAACPAADCRGFLSTAYKCGTCATQFCADCREPRPDDHVCDSALVATMTAIAKDTRGCPNCGTGISKVSGCDQMYCTSCDTAFSWMTGKVVVGVIHNPHYFERMKALKGSIPRQPGDEQCGGWPTIWRLQLGTAPQATLLKGLYQAAVHVQQVVLAEMPTEARATDNTDLRVRYLLKDIDEKKLQQLLQQRDRRRQRNLEVRAPLELFVLTVLEFFIELSRTKKAPTAESIVALQAQIRELVNEPLQEIGRRYSNAVPQINLDVAAKTRGYDALGWRPAKKAVAEEETEDAVIKHK
jgi:hypothetical protein